MHRLCLWRERTFEYVRTNTFGDQNQLTDYQKLLLHLPLNALRSPLVSFLPIIIVPFIRFIVDTSTVTNECQQSPSSEVSREQAREERRKWEQETSFKAKKALHQQAEEARKTSQRTQTGRQLLDPTVLKMISEQTEMAPISKNHQIC